jgi:hemerythrin
MPFVEWQDEHGVGIETFDRDSKRLFSLLNKLHAGVTAGETKENVARVFAAINIYVNFHFSEKEALYLRTSYPDYSAQRCEHQVFSILVEKMRQDFEDSASGALPRQVLEVLKSWLCERNVKSGRAFAAYLSENHVSLAARRGGAACSSSQANVSP